MQRFRNYALRQYNYQRSLPPEYQRPIKIGTYLMVLWAIRSTISTLVLLATIGTIAYAVYQAYIHATVK
jgi:hypothetical protein